MRSLVTSGVSPAAVTTFQEAQAMSTFASGQAAFLRNWDYAYADSQVPGTPTVGKVGVAPMPTFQGKTAPGYSNIGGWNLYINPHSKNIAADLTFIKFMASKQAQMALADGVLVDPDRRLGADLPRGHGREPGAGHRAEDQAGPAARGHAELPAAEHRDLHQRELGAGRLDLAVGGHVGGPVSSQHALSPVRPAACNRIADAQGQQVARHACWPWAAFRVTNITWAGLGDLHQALTGDQ